jgi:hypothetical protein
LGLGEELGVNPSRSDNARGGEVFQAQLNPRSGGVFYFCRHSLPISRQLPVARAKDADARVLLPHSVISVSHHMSQKSQTGPTSNDVGPFSCHEGDMSRNAKPIRLAYIVGWGLILAALCGVLVWKVAL